MNAPEPQRITLDDGNNAGPRSAPRLAIGEVIDRYRVDEILGVGGMGMVVRARDLDLDRDVALKVAVMASDPARDRRHAERLLREARAMARLRVRNVRAVHDVGSVNGVDFIAMEYVAGVDLARWLATPRRVPDIVGVFAAAGRGLAAAHAAGVLHRDFKPSNVLVGDDGEVVVTDFGLSRWLHEARPGDAAGTPRYMAPDADRADPRSDQYSFCVALGEALAHAAPGAAGTRARRRLERLVGRGSAVSPAARYPSMAAVVAELEAAVRASDRGQGRSAAPRGLEGPPVDRSRWPRVIALVAVAGVMAFALADRPRDRLLSRARDQPGGPAREPAAELRPADLVAASVRRPVDLELEQARALAARGYLRSARRHAEAAAAIARDHAPTHRAAAQYEVGLIALLQEQTSAARPALEAAVQLADEERDDSLRARALLALFRLAATRGSDLDVADRAERAAVAALARTEPDRHDRLWLRLSQGILAWKHGHEAELPRAMIEARALVTPPTIDDLVEWGETLRGEAGLATLAGDRDAAIVLLRELVATADRVGGPDHMLSIGARGQLARTLEMAGRDAEAETVMIELRAAGQTAAGARLLAEILPPAARPTHLVRVAVRDRRGAPVAGATVVAATAFHSNAIHLLGAQSLYAEREQATALAVSDDRGIAALPVADDARLWFAAEHPAIGRAPSVLAPPGDPVQLVLSPWGTLAGTAPANAKLSLVPERAAAAPPIVVRSTAQGRFASTRIPHGRYTVAFCIVRDEVERCGARPAVVSSQPGELALTLPTGSGQLTVRPRDELARPIESSFVALAPGDYAPADFHAFEIGWPDAVARGRGAFVGWTSVHDTSAARFAGVPPGRYSLCATAIHGDTDDPSFVSRLEARAAPPPLFCTPVTVGTTAVERALVIPASRRIWLGDQPRGAAGPQRAGPLHE